MHWCIQEVRVLRADILYDAGLALNAVIDMGQVEGAFVMGQGFFLTEEVLFSSDGVCETPGTWEYKPPLALDIPRDFRVEFLKDSKFPGGVKGSKAVGEPPLLLAYTVFGATRAAISASRVERGKSPFFSLDVPATCDRVRMAADVCVSDLIHGADGIAELM